MQHLGVHTDNEIKACLLSGISTVEAARRCHVSLMTVLRRKRQLNNPPRQAWQPQNLSSIISPNTVSRVVMNLPRTCPGCGTIARLSDWWQHDNECPFCHQVYCLTDL